MTIIDRDMPQTPIKCHAPDCQNTFVIDTDEYPPRRYCSIQCRKRGQIQRYRARIKKKLAAPEAAPGQTGDSSGTAPADAPKPHGDTPESSPG